MRVIVHIALAITGLLATIRSGAQGIPPAEPERVRGIEGRVALYASTNANREAAAWFPADTVFIVSGTLKEDVWVPVEAPEGLNVWLYRDLVRSGCVVSDKSLVRAGPGLTYPYIATLNQGDTVETRGSYGDWLKIKPPPGLRFWVLRDQVEALAMASSETGTSENADGHAKESAILAFTNILATPPAAEENPTAAVPPPELGSFTLEARSDQGRRITLTGVLDWGTVGAVQTPFCIVARDANGDSLPTCHLLAAESAYSSHIGETVTVEGTAWYVRNAELPLVIPTRIRTGN